MRLSLVSSYEDGNTVYVYDAYNIQQIIIIIIARVRMHKMAGDTDKRIFHFNLSN